MDIKRSLLSRIVGRIHKSTGLGGHVAGWIMGLRSSNVARNRWAVELLDVQWTDRIIELGRGPGVATAIGQSTTARANEAVQAVLEPFITPDGPLPGSWARLVTASRP